MDDEQDDFADVSGDFPSAGEPTMFFDPPIPVRFTPAFEKFLEEATVMNKEKNKTRRACDEDCIGCQNRNFVRDYLVRCDGCGGSIDGDTQHKVEGKNYHPCCIPAAPREVSEKGSEK